MAGNVNTSFSIERRQVILLKVQSKLVNLALTKAGKETQGLLFGDSFVKELGRYVGAFTALDKSQSSMRRDLPTRFFARDGRPRGRLVDCNNSCSSSQERPLSCSRSLPGTAQRFIPVPG